MPDAPRVYLDANVYLAWIRGEEDRADVARQLLTAAEDKRLVVVASTLLYAEICCHGDVRSVAPKEVKDVAAKVRAFLDGGLLRWIELDLPTARHAETLGRAHRLRGADAVHLASAVRGKAERFMTWDTDFPQGQNVEGVKVQEPRAIGQTTLPIESRPRDSEAVPGVGEQD